ncbi:hypothetical protein MNQ98_12155 [Paenibacillus sp. N3/727]|uniref:hypothetical protein n=1 Tax=Paenibacillus sp. N3/727 TaxID=2925845 RepID=UPI001F537420|nr:hypothetical protein [Paenibacillus sp. N3/727]UNK20713.1 hypothetical protein MNQ98_12155 [Paenibacillus sp. N3/727]
MWLWKRKKKRKTPDLRQSFLLSHRGGEIWISCIDNLDDDYSLIKEKVLRTEQLISTPTHSSYVLYHLDGTDITFETAELIIDSLIRSQKFVSKLALVGVTRKGKANINKYVKSTGTDFKITSKYFSSMDIAKDWLVREGHY